jgi:hypothetical protein
MAVLNIVLNGPSLSKDLHKFEKGHAVLCCNHFIDSKFYKKIQPDFYLFQDQYFCSPNVRGEYISKRDATFELILKTKLINDIVVPDKRFHRKLLDLDCRFSDKQFHYINAKSRIFNQDIFKIFKPKSSLSKLLMKAGVLTPSLDNAIIGGVLFGLKNEFKEIRLYGASLSYFKGLEIDNDQRLVNIIKYSDHEISRLVYHGKVGFKPQTISGELAHWARVFKMLELCNYFSTIHGVKVINYSDETYIDAFPRSASEELSL